MTPRSANARQQGPGSVLVMDEDGLNHDNKSHGAGVCGSRATRILHLVR